MSAAKTTIISDQEFLEIRARLLEVAAELDRTARRSGEAVESAATNDPRLAKLLASIDILKDSASNRAEKIQMHFSRPYNRDWREDFKL